MPKINLSTMVQKPLSLVYKILERVDNFHFFMRDVKGIKIIKRLENMIISEWKVDIDGTPVEWIQEDLYDKNKSQIEFRMLEGDFQEYQGRWIFEPRKDHTKIILEANLGWGVPNFEKYVGTFLEKKASESIRGMLWVIRREINRTEEKIND